MTVAGCRSIPMYIPDKHRNMQQLILWTSRWEWCTYCIWFHKRLKQFLFTQVMIFYKHAHPGFVEIPDETKRRETPNSIFGDETDPSLKNNFESSGFDRFLFIKFSMVKLGLQLIAWMEFHPQKMVGSNRSSFHPLMFFSLRPVPRWLPDILSLGSWRFSLTAWRVLC